MRQLDRAEALSLFDALNEAGFDALLEANPRGVNMYGEPGSWMRYIVTARIDTEPARLEELTPKFLRVVEIAADHGMKAWFSSGYQEDREGYGMRVAFNFEA